MWMGVFVVEDDVESVGTLSHKINVARNLNLVNLRHWKI